MTRLATRAVRGGIEADAHHGAVTPPLLEVIRSAGVDLNVWTVDDPDQVARLRAMGVSGICSNDPRILNEPLTTAGAQQ